MSFSGKTYYQLLYREVYILNNSTYYKYNKKEFNISGFIRYPQPKVKKNDLILMINTNYSTMNVNCIIKNLTRNDYSLYFKANESKFASLPTLICALYKAVSI